MANRARPRALNCQQFVQYISTSVADINRQIQQSQEPEVIDNATFRVDSLINNLHRMQREIDDDETFSSLNERLQELMKILQELDPVDYDDIPDYTPLIRDGKPGRPSYAILPGQLSWYLGLGFSVTDIAHSLGVDRSTVHDRLRRYGMSVGSTYSTISDDELDGLVTEIVQHNRNLGYRMVRSHLIGKGHRVPYERVRLSLLSVDEAAVAMRFGNTVQRRQYRVASPNSLWHFDGNHKLIRFKFVVHGGIDGYSRFMVWLKVATNNRAQTAYNHFEEAVRKYSRPSRVRCDRGVENGMIVRDMIQSRPPNHRAAIIGPSVHNQRIERAWVDVFQGSLCVFYDLFSSMVNGGSLDLTNEIQTFAFQYVFKPIIQRSLDRCRDALNCRPLTSERCKSPAQLFVGAMLKQRRRPTTGVADYWARVNQEEPEVPNIEGNNNDERPIPELDQLTSGVRLDDIACPVTDDVAQELAETINPTEMCSHDAAVDVYRSVLQFLVDKGY